MSNRWVPVCQWCGESGGASNCVNRPSYNPIVLGNCPSHPSGKSDAKHGSQWVQD